MAPETLTGGQALVRQLVREGVKTIFGLPGVQLDWAFDALYEARDAIRVYHARHEQATAYMADGFARTTGKVGLCMVVPGPGLLNASAALATAYACSSPVVCITSQIDSHAIDGGYGLLHEVHHQDAILGAITKWQARAFEPSQIPAMVAEAFSRAASGRPRPTGLELPVDVLQSTQTVCLVEPTKVKPEGADPDLVRQAAALLRGAERPVIYSGGGTLAAGAWTELKGLAELLEAPVVMSVDGRGALDDRDDLAHTGVTGQALIREADLVIGVGTRFWQPARVWGLAPGAKLIRIDADAEELERLGKPTVGIVADAKLALTALRGALDSFRSQRPSGRAELRRRKAEAAERLAAYQPQADLARAIRNVLPEDAITVNDLTQVTFYATVGFPVYTPRTFIGPGYQGTLGSAFATALGAQVGNPERVVLALAGDGGFLYSLGELATQRQHGISVISIVFNDGAYGNVKRTQQDLFAGRTIASDLVNPDFVALARSFGIDSERVASAAQLEGALRSAISARKPALIEVTIDSMSNVWPVIGPAGGIYPLVLGAPAKQP